jgi:hypothetical protein
MGYITGSGDDDGIVEDDDVAEDHDHDVDSSWVSIVSEARNREEAYSSLTNFMESGSCSCSEMMVSIKYCRATESASMTVPRLALLVALALLVLELELVLSDMMGVVSLNREDRGDAESCCRCRFGTIVKVDRMENGVAVSTAVMRCDEVWIEEEEDDDCRGRKAPTETRVVDDPKTHK